MRNFCTIFDHNYLPRFLTMYYSLKEHSNNFRIYVFCMDEECHLKMNELCLDSVTIIIYTELEEHDKELYSIKKTRSLIEYYFTCTPAICNYVFDKYPDVGLLTYLDSDLYFFSSPEVVFEEIGEKSIAIVEHRFSKYGLKFVKLGKYNVAWITFRRDEQGLKCLKEYRQQCLDWCYDYLDGNKYADQKYLDQWPKKYSDLIVIKNKGVNLACWNIGNYTISKREDTIYADDNKLVFYHFAGLQKLNAYYYSTSISSYYVKLVTIIKKDIYTVYIDKLISFSINDDITKKTINPKYLKFSVKKTFKKILRNCRIILFNDLIRV